MENSTLKVRIQQGLLLCFSIIILVFNFSYINKIINNKGISTTGERYVKVVDYDKDTNIIEIEIQSTDDEMSCTSSLILDDSDLIYESIVDNKCHISIPFSKQYVYFMKENGALSIPYSLENLLVDVAIKDEYYVPIGNIQDFSDSFTIVGDVNISLYTDSEYLSIDGLRVEAIGNGESNLYILNEDYPVKIVRYVSTNVITEMPNEFDYGKPHLPCNQFSAKESKLIDEILAYRIEEAGYGTRAGVVEAARFLTLEFPFRINYFYENGRVNRTGTHYTDGEGRYYHHGMYLGEDKFEDIKASLAGPAIWGCPLKNYEPDEPQFIWGRKYPNGLDCSGFVSWVLYNGGTEPGDVGTGQLPELGKSVEITDSLIRSDRIKVGDLFSAWWHISILVGMDDNYFYIAESLPTLNGVVISKYKKYQVHYWFTNVILMDDYYNGDGNLTNLWY